MPTAVRMETVTGQCANMRGKSTLTLRMGETVVKQEVWLADIQEDCILGLDALRAVGAVIWTREPQLEVGDRVLRALAGPHKPGGDRNSPRTQCLAPSPWTGVSAETASALEELCQRSRVGLNQAEGEQLQTLLVEYRHLFASSDLECGHTNLVQHHIDTGNATPVRQRARRLPLLAFQGAEAKIREMAAAGVIEPSDSPWVSPAVLVHKKDGSLRFCVDYRRLNSLTRKDSYPLPRIDEALDCVSGSKWFSSLDLRSGYWQVEMAPDSRAKTAFTIGRGLWQFKVMPFGLCNSPATFERLMERVLGPTPRSACVVYLDDLLVHAATFAEALSNLRLVLERIQAANLRLSPKKCHLLQQEVRFLGHVVGPAGVSTDPEKVIAVRDWPTPTSTKEVRSFLGLASYYRRFVHAFADKARPLHQITEKGRRFQWTEACEGSFQALRKALTQTPVLALPDMQRPFILDTDASNEGLGAVLSQPSEGGERVVAYYSRALSREERNYCVTRRELLAVVQATKHFKPYLYGTEFLLRTDHASLRWLLSFKEPEGQVARWIEALQGLTFNTEHRRGSRHTNADALSRRPCADQACHHCSRLESREQQQTCQVTVRAVGTPRAPSEGLSPAKVGELQCLDDHLGPVIHWLKQGGPPSREEAGPHSTTTKALLGQWDSLMLHDGCLYRAWEEPRRGGRSWQLVIPRALQQQVLQMVHGAPGVGHFGITKTLRRLQDRFYWGRCRRDVERFCRRCGTCNAKKGPVGQTRAPLQQYRVGAPMERVGVDVVGPLPVSEDGNRYILTVMDYFTKWPEAYAIPNQLTSTIVDCLVDGMFTRFGVPEELHSDQGRNFESQVFGEVCRRLGVNKTRTTPLHPQSDGLVERFNRTLVTQLAMLTSTHQRDWDRHLPLVLMAYRSAVQESTGCTPASLMFGRELRTPVDLSFGRPPNPPLLGPPGQDYVDALQDRMEATHQLARGHMASAGQRQKRAYDSRSRQSGYQPGDQVWVYNPRRRKGRCPKLDSDWEGPCRVIKRISEVTYRLQLHIRPRIVVLHQDRLAPFVGLDSDQVFGVQGGDRDTGLTAPPSLAQQDSGGDGEGGGWDSGDTAPPPSSVGGPTQLSPAQPQEKVVLTGRASRRRRPPRWLNTSTWDMD